MHNVSRLHVWDLTNSGFPSSALVPEVRAYCVLAWRYQHQCQMCQATQHSLQLDIRMFSRNAKTALRQHQRASVISGMASYLGSACPSHMVCGWRRFSTNVLGGTFSSIDSPSLPHRSSTRPWELAARQRNISLADAKGIRR